MDFFCIGKCIAGNFKKLNNKMLNGKCLVSLLVIKKLKSNNSYYKP